MATPSLGAKPRRKLATYGKASRRGNTTHQGLASNKPSLAQSCDTFQYERTISGRIRKDGATSPPELCRGSPESSVNHDEPLPVTCNGSQLRFITPAIVTTEGFEDYQNNVIYDVPSSDEHSAVSFGLRARSSSKRRKLNAVSMEEYSSVVWDDESLQKHIATETAVVIGKRLKSSKPQVLSKTSTENSNLSSKGKRIDLSTRPPRVIGETVLSGAYIEDNRSILVKPEVVLTEPASSTKTQYDMSSTSQAVLARTEKQLSGLKSNELKHTDLPADTLKKRGKPLLFNTSGSNSSSLPVRNGSRGGSRSSSFQSNLISAQGVKTEEPAIYLGKQGLSPGRLAISSLDISNLEGASSIPHVYQRNNQQAQRLVHTSPASSRMKIKDRLHTPRKPSGLLRKADFEISSDSDSESILCSPSSARSQTALNFSNEAAVNSVFNEKSGSQSHSSTGASSRQNGLLKVTYGRQRSFLSENFSDEVFSTNTPASDKMKFRTATKVTGPRNDLLNPPKLPILSEAMDESTESNTAAIRSIHELREAGGNARMTGDIEATLDDIDENNNTPLSHRRSGLLEVAMKLQQPEFCRRFIDLGLETRLLAHVNSCTDTIAGILLLTAILQIIAHPISSHIVAEFAAPGVLNFLGRYLECQEDVKLMVRTRRSNMSKALQTEVIGFCASFMLADVWRSGQPAQITGHILSLQCLEYIVRHLREAGSTSDMLSHEILERLIDILIPSHNAAVLTLGSRTTVEIQLSLSILESSSIADTTCLDGRDMSWTSRSIAKMAGFLSFIQMQTGPQAGTLRTLALRLCLNLTNNNSTICHAFSDPKVIHATLFMIGSSFSTLASEAVDDSTEIVVDNLVLSLGLLINLAEWNESTRELFLLSDDDKRHPLSTLSEIFESNIDRISEVRFFTRFDVKYADHIQVTSEKEIRFNIPFGYLSILLSFLSISASIRQRIRSRLQGQMLSTIFGAAEEFLQYHRQITGEILEAEEGNDLKANFVSRVQSVVDRLKQEEQVHHREASRM
ncbi:hypothetical protein MMC32_007715 [Xylographa parallela]|nr:hypothetical protein [Xylographa parallela]